MCAYMPKQAIIITGLITQDPDIGHENRNSFCADSKGRLPLESAHKEFIMLQLLFGDKHETRPPALE